MSWLNMRTSRTIFKLDQVKRYSVCFQVHDYYMSKMRRTRSNSNAEMVISHTAAVKRSLRSTHNEEFFEIPTNFRMRSPRFTSGQQDMAEKELEKSPSTRRSTRLNNSAMEEIENTFSEVGSCRSRKRRLQSFPTDESPNCASRKTRASSAKDHIDGPKPSKLMHVEEDTKQNHTADSTTPPLTNGICSRTRQKLTENGISDSDEPNNPMKGSPVYETPNGIVQDIVDCVSVHTRSFRKIASCPNDSDTSPARDLKDIRCNGSPQFSNDTSAHSDVRSIVSEKLASCNCNDSAKRNSKNVCEFCGKPRTCTQGHNGSVVNSPVKSPDGANAATPLHNLRSSGQALTAVSLSPSGGNGSPMAGEEATKVSRKMSADDHSLYNLRRSRRISEKGEFPLSSLEEHDSSESTVKKQNSNSHSSADDSSLKVVSEPSSSMEDKVIKEECTGQKPKEAQQDSPLKRAENDSTHSESTEKTINKQSSMHEQSQSQPKSPKDDINNSQGDEPESGMDEFSCGLFDFSHLSDSSSDDTCQTKRKRKMNLRSSGVRCDPDFYTLSLDLMIKRSQKKYLASLDPDQEEMVNGSKEDEVVAHIQETETNELTEERERTKDFTSMTQKKDGAKKSELQTTSPVVVDSEMPAHTDVEKTAKSADKNADSEQENADSVPELTSQSQVADQPGNLPQKLLQPQHSSTPNRTLPDRALPRARGRFPRGLVTSKIEKTPAPGFRMVVPDPREPPPLFTEEPPSGPDVYYFESDHVALKHNQDYHNLLHTVSMLESQRLLCLKDIETLESKKTNAMDEPISFVEKLQSQVQVDLPRQQHVPDLPEVNWSRYTSVYGTFDHVFTQDFTPSPQKPVTRKKKINFETGVPLQHSQKSSTSKNKNDFGKQGESSRSQTFKKSWSVEEQRKLEELLIKYPSEDIEFNRFRKIAAELGNRTAMQVQSRVQKYFLKLAKAGLPVPGRMPKMDRSSGCLRNRKARPHPHQSLTRMSTFFPTFHVPVRMQDDDGQDSGRPAVDDDEGGGWTIEQDQVSDEEDVLQEVRYSDEYLEILRLKRMRRERLRVLDQHGRQAVAQHVGYECDMCNSDPIQGVRYHCIDCPEADGVDLCQSCIRWQGQFVTDTHKTSHRMEPVYKAENFTDNDYTKFTSRSGEYNYLDPNFCPPST